MLVGIVGSRSFNDYELLKRQMDSIQGVTGIVSGGADGADTLGAKYADDHGLPLIVYRPDWKKYGKKAGYLRNALIVRDADLVIAFWDGESRGTKSTIDICVREGVPYQVVQVV